MYQKVIDLKNIDRETKMLYSGSISFDYHPVFDQNELKLSDNKLLGRHFTDLLLRRVVRTIKQLPESSNSIEITFYPDGLVYTWEFEGARYSITSLDSNAIPATVVLGLTNRIVVHGSTLIETRDGSAIKTITLHNRPYAGRDEWRKLRGDRNLIPYIVSANIADLINQEVGGSEPLINFQMIESLIILDVQPNQFTIAFDVMGQLYTLTAVTI